MCQVGAASQKIQANIIPCIWLLLFHMSKSYQENKALATWSDSCPPITGTRQAEMSLLQPMASGPPLQLARNTCHHTVYKAWSIDKAWFCQVTQIHKIPQYGVLRILTGFRGLTECFQDIHITSHSQPHSLKSVNGGRGLTQTTKGAWSGTD